MQNVVAVIVLGSIGWAYVRRLVLKPPRLTLNRDALLILGMIGGVVATELFAAGLRGRRARRDHRRLRLERARHAAPRGAPPEVLQAIFAILWWAHIALVAGVPRVPAVQQAPPHRDRVPEHLVPQARAARRAAEDGPRGRERDVRAEVAPGPRLEGPARRLHLHRVRSLPGGLPGLRTPASRSIPRRSSWASATCRSRRSTGSTSSRTRRSCARPTASTNTTVSADGPGQADRRRRDPVRRGLGLRDLRGVRRGLPGPHRARRQDRRACAGTWSSRRSRFPHELTSAFRAMENQGNPWGQPASARLDWTKPLPFEVPTVAAMAADGRLDELEVLYWVGCAAAFDTAQPEGRPGGGDLPARRRGPVRGPRPGGVVHRRSGPSDGQRLRLPDAGRRATSRRSTATGWASGRS